MTEPRETGGADVPPRLSVAPDDGSDPAVPGASSVAPDDAVASHEEIRAASDESAVAPDESAVAPDETAVLPDAPDDDLPLVAHDAAWFEDLVRTHTRALHRYLARRVGAGDADDLAADVLVVAWRRRDDVPDEAPLAWIYRTAGFVVANFRRKGRPVPVADVPDEAGDDDPAIHAVHDEQVREVLRRLSPRDRQIVLLNAWEGLAGEELAAVLGIGRGGADAALSRARSRLAAAWSDLS